MAGYINDDIPIKNFVKAVKATRNELYQYNGVDDKLVYDLRANKDNDNKDEIGILIATFLFRKSKWLGAGYWLMKDAIANTHIDNYRQIYAGLEWGKEKKAIQELLLNDKEYNYKYHAEVSDLIQKNSYGILAKRIAVLWLANKSIDYIETKILNKVIQGKSVLNGIGSLMPNENMRVYETIRNTIVTGKQIGRAHV